MKLLRWIDERLSILENWMLVLLLATMTVLAFILVLLRNMFHSGIQGADEFLRHLVLLVAFFGAAQGARLQKHITIDVLARLFSDAKKQIISIIVNIFTVFVAVWLSNAAVIYVISKKEAGTASIFGIKIWFFQLIIPVGFFLIAFHFFMHIIEAIQTLRRRKTE